MATRASEDETDEECAVAFGRNYFGATGGVDQASGIENAPFWTKDGGRISQVECTTQSTIFLTKAGNVFQTGTLHGVKHTEPVPVVIPLPLKCVEISAGRHFCLGRMEGGQAVVSWGAGHFGQLGLGPFSEGDSQITFSPHPIIVDRLLPRAIGSPIQKICCGDWHALALSESGRVWAWGSNRSQQCGRKPSSSSAASKAPTLLVPLPVPLELRAMDIAAGRSHSVAICNENVFCWGSTAHGQCGNSARRSGVTTPRLVEAIRNVRVSQIAAGGNHTLALSVGGRLFAWGSNLEGQLGTGPACQAQPKPRQIVDLDFVAIQAGQGLKHIQQDSSTQLDLAESERLAQTLQNVPRITSIAAGASYSAAVSSSGHLYAWGSNDVGQIGLKPPPDLVVKDVVLPTVNSRDLRNRENADVQTFDSRHNVLLPTRLTNLNDMFVKMVACGPNHMWCVGRRRREGEKDAVDRSLREAEQENSALFGSLNVGEGTPSETENGESSEHCLGASPSSEYAATNGGPSSLASAPSAEPDTAGTDTEASGVDSSKSPSSGKKKVGFMKSSPDHSKTNRKGLMKKLSSRFMRRRGRKSDDDNDDRRDFSANTA